MKKVNVIVQKMVIALIVLSVVCCGKKGITGINTQQCEARAKAVTDAITAYAASPSKTTCEAYKKALQDYVNDGVGCAFGAGDLTSARQAIESLTCQ